ncbi:hypothetical protein [Deinococcus sp. DB0503]|uniref:hypothetical protein n=1 Tax=Deinococcus sp. DB0503 TaxID=2479203 RepID=UPI00351CA3FB
MKLAGVPDVADFSWVGPTFFGPLVFMDAVWAGAALYAGPHEREPEWQDDAGDGRNRRHRPGNGAGAGAAGGASVGGGAQPAEDGGRSAGDWRSGAARG